MKEYYLCNVDEDERRSAVGTIVHTRYSYFVLSHILLPPKTLTKVQNNRGLVLFYYDFIVIHKAIYHYSSCS